jgi:hypothetical protein
LFFGSCISPLSASFAPLKALDPTLVSQLKETLPAALFEKLNGSLSIDQDRLKFVSTRTGSWKRDFVWSGSINTEPEAKNSLTRNWNFWNWSRVLAARK